MSRLIEFLTVLGLGLVITIGFCVLVGLVMFIHAVAVEVRRRRDSPGPL